MKEVLKKWGREVWIANYEEYCGKFLCLSEKAECSYHMHPVKKETFYVLAGTIRLTLEGEVSELTPNSQPVTIEPKQLHKFYGITDAVILEISSHHDDADVVRVEESHVADKPKVKQPVR